MMVNFLVDDMLVLAVGRGDFEFRDWLLHSGVLSLTASRNTLSGPFPPEVYDLFDQVRQS